MFLRGNTLLYILYEERDKILDRKTQCLLHSYLQEKKKITWGSNTEVDNSSRKSFFFFFFGDVSNQLLEKLIA